jgi:hypothetical protein
MAVRSGLFRYQAAANPFDISGISPIVHLSARLAASDSNVFENLLALVVNNERGKEHWPVAKVGNVKCYRYSDRRKSGTFTISVVRDGASGRSTTARRRETHFPPGHGPQVQERQEQITFRLRVSHERDPNHGGLRL